MITLANFRIIDQEVKVAANQVLDFIKDNRPDHDYILLLAEGEYKSELLKATMNLSPYVIDDFSDKDRDNTRINFWSQFLNENYSFPNGLQQINNDNYRIHLELMIYSQTWEAKPFLKKLFRLSAISNDEGYPWEVVVPEMGRHTFIRDDIRNKLKINCPLIAEVISKGFHTSLRNAFAHSEYSFNDYRKGINLYTYKGEKWDFDFISFDDWAKRFAYTVFLNYHLLNFIHTRRMRLVQEFGKSDFEIVHPINRTSFRILSIRYDVERDYFNFIRNLS